MTTTVREVMSGAPPVVDPEMSAPEFRRVLQRRHLDSAVVSQGDQLLGVVTDFDIALGLAGAVPGGPGDDVDALRVRDLACHRLVTIGPDEPVAHALQTMVEQGVRCLLVLDANQPIGMVGSQELIGVLAGDLSMVAVEI